MKEKNENFGQKKREKKIMDQRSKWDDENILVNTFYHSFLVHLNIIGDTTKQNTSILTRITCGDLIFGVFLLIGTLFVNFFLLAS